MSNYYHYKFTLFQKVATVDGIGFIFAVSYDHKLCDVCLNSGGSKTYHFDQLVKRF